MMPDRLSENTFSMMERQTSLFPFSLKWRMSMRTHRAIQPANHPGSKSDRYANQLPGGMRMPDALARLKTDLQNKGFDPVLLNELEKEYAELVKKGDELEKLLIMIVRSGWPWDEDGEPNALHHAAKNGFVSAMAEARDLLGLNLATRITRTEPKT
jgi:hypothetical protein